MFFCVVVYGLFHGLCYLPVLLSFIGPAPDDSAQSNEDKTNRLSSAHPSGSPGEDDVICEKKMTSNRKTPVRNGKRSAQNVEYPIQPQGKAYVFFLLKNNVFHTLFFEGKAFR